MGKQFYKLLGTAMTTHKRNSIGTIDELERNAQTTKQIILKLYQQNPGMTRDEIFRIMTMMMEGIVFQIAEIDDFKSISIRRNAAKYLTTNLYAIEQEYQKLIEEERQTGKKLQAPEITVYDANKKKAIRQLMIAVISDIRIIRAEANPNDIRILRSVNSEGIKEIRKSLEKENDTKEGKLSARNTVNFLGNSPEIQKVKYYFSSLLNQEKIEKEMKDSYIEAISKIGIILNDFGLIEQYVNRQERTTKRLGLQHWPNQNKDEAYEKIFNKEELKKLNISQLSALYAFWNNRFVKELIDIYRSYFIMHELNLDTKENLEKSNIFQNITPEELEAFNIKINLIGTIVRNIYRKHRAENINGGNVCIEDELDEIKEQIGSDYEGYFCGMGGLRNLKNNFREDFMSYLGLENTIENCYMQKDRSIEGLLIQLFNGELSSNWGIIPENKRSKFILIGVDINGLNMPLRLHVTKDAIKGFVKENQGNTMIPIYQGKDDFVVGGTYVTTHLLMPLNKQHKEAIETTVEKIDDSDYRSKFVKHVRFLSDSQKYPEHLKKKVEVRKKGKIKIKSEKIEQYMDLETGKLYELKRGEFVEQFDGGRDD